MERRQCQHTSDWMWFDLPVSHIRPPGGAGVVPPCQRVVASGIKCFFHRILHEQLLKTVNLLSGANGGVHFGHLRCFCGDLRTNAWSDRVGLKRLWKERLKGYRLVCSRIPHGQKWASYTHLNSRQQQVSFIFTYKALRIMSVVWDISRCFRVNLNRSELNRPWTFQVSALRECGHNRNGRWRYFGADFESVIERVAVAGRSIFSLHLTLRPLDLIWQQQPCSDISSLANTTK